MRSMILYTVGLLAAGFVFEWLRQRLPSSWQARLAGSRWRRRAKALAVLLVLAFPIATLLLAKLFRSDALGWIFGLTLIFGLAMLPCAAIFYVGMKLNSRMGRRQGKSPEAVAPLTAQLSILVHRGSVHASDEATSKRISVQKSATVRAMLQLAIADAYLPSISGGEATWVVELAPAGGGAAFAPIAVCTQQWAEPAFLVPADGLAAALFGGAAPRLNFRYRCQDEPHAVLTEMTAMRQPEGLDPVVAVQRQVIDALRSGGMGFFTANKEGGSHLFFDGQVFRRNDYGDEPNLSEIYADDAAMLACLRRFYNWDAQRDVYPHPKAELDVWKYILGQLRKRG